MVVRRSLANEELRRNHRTLRKVCDCEQPPDESQLLLSSNSLQPEIRDPLMSWRKKGPASFADAGPSIQLNG